jgi:hypothetical protein
MLINGLGIGVPYGTSGGGSGGSGSIITVQLLEPAVHHYAGWEF